MDFDAFGVIVSMVRPTAVELSVVTGVGPGWGWPISSRVNKNGAVVEIGSVLFGKIKICCCSAFGAWFGEIRSVGVKGEDHVTGAVADGGVGMGGNIIQELMAGI
eukprot:scaffold81332_cov22-Cyclotella_meneghiniana.AAC.2